MKTRRGLTLSIRPCFGTDQVKFRETGSPEGVAAGKPSLQVIREALESPAKRRSDHPSLFYLDGLNLYGAEDAEVRSEGAPKPG